VDREFIRKYEINRRKEDISKTTNNKDSRHKVLCHVVIATYETMMSESQLFKDILFEVVVCDEGFSDFYIILIFL
jgi:SNF2 family DNA or RNA helicase